VAAKLKTVMTVRPWVMRETVEKEECVVYNNVLRVINVRCMSIHFQNVIKSVQVLIHLCFNLLINCLRGLHRIYLNTLSHTNKPLNNWHLFITEICESFL
jgi:hypothetical protein